MHVVNLQTLEAVVPPPPASLEDLLALDAEVRSVARQCVDRLTA
jgi:hypothetical protein